MQVDPAAVRCLHDRRRGGVQSPDVRTSVTSYFLASYSSRGPRGRSERQGGPLSGPGPERKGSRCPTRLGRPGLRRLSPPPTWTSRAGRRRTPNGDRTRAPRRTHRPPRSLREATRGRGRQKTAAAIPDRSTTSTTQLLPHHLQGTESCAVHRLRTPADRHGP